MPFNRTVFYDVVTIFLVVGGNLSFGEINTKKFDDSAEHILNLFKEKINGEGESFNILCWISFWF
jgi:hypothetical protein